MKTLIFCGILPPIFIRTEETEIEFKMTYHDKKTNRK